MNGVSYRASLLALCLAMFSFLACSPEQGRQQDTDENAEESIRVDGRRAAEDLRRRTHAISIVFRAQPLPAD